MARVDYDDGAVGDHDGVGNGISDGDSEDGGGS